MLAEPIVYIALTDGTLRPAFETEEVCQFVFADDKRPVNGVWFIPRSAFTA